jgi:hypothetical protein
MQETYRMLSNYKILKNSTNEFSSDHRSYSLSRWVTSQQGHVTLQQAAYERQGKCIQIAWAPHDPFVWLPGAIWKARCRSMEIDLTEARIQLFRA